MRLRFFASLLILLFALPLAAALTPGEVFLRDRTTSPTFGGTSDLWIYSGGRYAGFAGGVALIYQVHPWDGAEHLLLRAPNLVLIEKQRTVSLWDAVERYYSDPETGVRQLVTSDTDLGEIAPARSGNFLVPERWAAPDVGAKLIEFNLGGRVAEYPLPKIPDPAHNRVLGATHIELLGDGCTLLYTLGNDDPNGGRVRRFNLCTRAAEPDFVVLPAGDYAGALRQLPTGDVIVANGSAVRQYTPQGLPVRQYAFNGVTHLALTPDGHAFYAAAADHKKGDFRLYQVDAANDPPQSIQLGNDAMQSPFVVAEIIELAVVDEWRAAQVPVRTRAVRHAR
jgi:hypothetical protein